MATNYSPRIVTDGLVMCLDAGNQKSYPGSGTAWNDLSFTGNNATLANGTAYSASAGGSLSFDGIDDVADVSASLGTLSNYTIMYWAYRQAEGRMPVAGRLNTAFYWYGDYSWAYTHGGVWGEYYYSKPTSIPLNTWGCLCVVYNGSNVTIYRQGIYQGQQSTTGTADWSQGLRVGYWSAGGSYAWQGLISNVLMYSTALNQSQVSQNFNATRSRFGL